MKIYTSDFGEIEIKPIKKFQYKGFDFVIVNYPYKYMGVVETYYTKGVFEYSTGRKMSIGSPQRGWKLSDYQQALESSLDSLILRGAIVQEELDKFEILNN